MTATICESVGTLFKVGDKVRVNERGSADLVSFAGLTGVVDEGGLIPLVKPDENRPDTGDRTAFFLNAGCWDRVVEEPATKVFEIGDKVRVSADAKTHGGGAVFFGKAVDATVVGVPGSGPYGDLDYQVETEEPHGGGDPVTHQFVGAEWLTLLEVDVPTHKTPADRATAILEIERLRVRAEQAEQALKTFRHDVAEAVISEAGNQGWCDRVDGWLEELGLPTRYGDLPRERFAVILTTDGRTGVREDDDDHPWHLYTDDGNCSQWKSDAEVAPLHKTTLFEGQG